MSDIKINVDLNSNDAKRGLQQLKGAIGGVGSAANGVTGSFLKLAAAAGGIAAAVQGIRGIAQTGASFEDLRSSLNSVFGSVEEGGAAFERVKQFAEGTQFSVQQLTKNFVQLKAAGVEPTTDLLQVFADTASVTTDELGTFQASMDLIARTTAGGLGLEELNRLADRGVPVFDILNEKLGVTRLEISEVGKTAEGARQIIDALTEGLEERFGGASIARAQNLNQILNNLGDTVDNLQSSLFDLGFGDFFKTIALGAQEGIRSLTQFVNANQEVIGTFLDNLLDGIATTIQNFIIGGGALIDAFSPVFNFLREGVNNLVGFMNLLPPELKGLGLIGFLMLGFKGKALLLIISSMFDSIIQLMSSALQALTPVMNFFVDLTNQAIGVINKAIGLSNRFLGTDFEPIELVKDFNVEDFAPEKLKGALTDLVDLIADVPLISTVGPVEENARRIAESIGTTLSSIRDRLGNVPVPKIGGKDPEESGQEVGAKFSDGFARGLEAFKTATLDSAAYGERIFKTMTDGFTDAIMTFVETGKLSFKDLFRSLMTEIIKMQANKIFLALFGGAQTFFAGLFDKGGYIPAGQFGIAGEKGPEIVNGPARITSTDETARMMQGKQAPQIIYNINAVDVQSFRQALARDPEFVYNLTRVGARRVPG